MPSFDAPAFGLLIALAMATGLLVIPAIRRAVVVPVVRVVRVIVPIAPSRAGRK